MKRTIGSTALGVGALVGPLGSPAEAAHADTTAPRIDPRSPVVSDGGPSDGAIASEPGAAVGVPVQGTTSRAPRTRVPAAVTEQVPCAPDN
ncbi:hypothetical protein [Streptomyces siamensis]|uniref:Tat pathway signal sequence domain protein n=1 Tax=Streptomyces siamensis TaxID=1274986 RepID=A0ABP9ISY1_9ACTN